METPSIEMAAFMTISNTLTGIVTSLVTARKVRAESDTLVSDAVARKTQQLFDNQQVLINSAQQRIEQLEKTVNDCHKEHAVARKRYDGLKAINEEMEKRLKQLENALRNEV